MLVPTWCVPVWWNQHVSTERDQSSNSPAAVFKGGHFTSQGIAGSRPEPTSSAVPVNPKPWPSCICPLCSRGCKATPPPTPRQRGIAWQFYRGHYLCFTRPPFPPCPYIQLTALSQDISDDDDWLHMWAFWEKTNNFGRQCCHQFEEVQACSLFTFSNWTLLWPIFEEMYVNVVKMFPRRFVARWRWCRKSVGPPAVGSLFKSSLLPVKCLQPHSPELFHCQNYSPYSASAALPTLLWKK